MEEKLKNLFDKAKDEFLCSEYKRIEEIIENLNVIVPVDISKAEKNKSKTDVDRIESYMPLLQEWMLKLKDKRDFIAQKLFAKVIIESNNKLQNAFSEEAMNEYANKFQKMVDEKSKEYERM